MLISILKRSYKYTSLLNLKRGLHESPPHAVIISDYFGVPPMEAQKYAAKHKITGKDPEALAESIKICQKLGYTNDEIYENPSLMKMNPITLDQRYLMMEEGGFDQISPHILAKGRSLMKKMVTELKLLQLINKDVSVQKCFEYYLQPKPEGYKLETLREATPWNIIQMKVLKEFLKKRLQATEDDIVKLFRVHKMIAHKSLRVVQENIDLALNLGFTPAKILRSGYILHSYPNYTKKVLEELNNLAGSDMCVAIRRYPKLFMVSPKNFIKIYGILKQFDVPDETIRKSMNIFQLSPETVKLRLEEIQKVPELKVLFENPYILSLVIHHKRAKSRLSYLQQLQLKCANVTVLGKHYEFDDHIREGKDINRRGDTLKFLANLFKVTNKETLSRRWRLHPYSFQVPFIDMENTFNHLRSLDFEIKDIYGCMHIILYPVEKINKALDEIQRDNKIKSQAVTKAQILNLMLYFIEKEHHFTGNGIWQKYEVETPDKILE